MASDQPRPIHFKAKTDFGEAAMILGVFALIVLFWGDPDLHDAWVSRVNGGGAVESAEAPPAPIVLDGTSDIADAVPDRFAE